ncbi:MAG: hypothetical protein IJ877_02840 [Candidatus Gastranaerophilales bacterium]|nr:hypothetical protein [Candidatus Gastranaerophilales bacterium]
MTNSTVEVMKQNCCEVFEKLANDAVSEVKARAGKQGQFLNWIEVLPNLQLKNLDNLYDMAQNAKGTKFTDLAILGIGGSRHTTENITKLLGLEDRVHFFSSVEPTSFDRFIKKLDLDKTLFLVVSKSGTTLETTVGYNNTKSAVEKYLNSKDTSNNFVAMTDKNSEKSALRRIVDSGEIKLSGFVHDDVGGRFSIFDDATIFTLFFLGVSKDEVKAMLNASLDAQIEFLNPSIDKNEALQLARFNVCAKNSGKNKHFVEYFGDEFFGTTLWEKQLKNESLKSRISTDTNVGPGYLHYNAEADLDVNNTDSFFTFVYVKTDDKTMNAVMEGVISAYSAQHPVSKIVLDDLSMKSIARFIELKHFETLYTGIILRAQKGDYTPSEIALDEVLQPNVEKYKREVKKALAK